MSPDGSWRLFQTSGAWWRSNGGAWSSVPLPTPSGAASNAIIRNDGSIAVAYGAGGWAAFVRSTLSVQLFENGAWSSFPIGQGATWNDTTITLESDGPMLVAVANSYGLVFSSTDAGRTWAGSGAMATGSTSLRTIGGFVHMVTPGGYQRWSYATRQPAVPAGAPTAMTAGQFLSGPGSTSTVYLVDARYTGTGMTLFQSTDSGASWAAVVWNEPLPFRQSTVYGQGVPFADPRVGSDGDLHLYGATTESGVVVVYEAIWDLPSGGWQATTRFATGLPAGALSVWPSQRVDGTVIGAIDRWVSRAASGWEAYSLIGGGLADPLALTAQGSNGMRVLGSAAGGFGAVSTSPNGSWQAVVSSSHVWRSSNGASWEGIPRPANTPAAQFAIRNDGSIVGVGATPSGTTLFSSTVKAVVFEGSQWRGPIAVGPGRTWNDGDVSLIDDGSTLLIVTGQGAVHFSTTIGRQWAGGAPLASGGRIDRVGDIAHVVQQNVASPQYSRWSFTTKAPVQFPNPDYPANPNAPQFVNSLLVPQFSRIVRTPGSTTEVWLASGGSSLTLRRSSNNGLTYDAAPTVTETFPSGMSATTFTVSSDGRLHAYSQSVCSNATLVYSTSHALGAQAGWTNFVTHYLDETKTATLIDSPTGGTGVTAPGPEVWFARSEPGVGFLQRSIASSVSIESVYGMDPFGVSVGGVSSAIGSYSTSASDATIATIGPELSITRTYNSADQRVGLFGRGWSTNLESRVFENCVTGDVVALLGDGSRLPFTKSGTTYIPAPGVTSTLTKTGTTWTLTSLDGVVHAFRTDGRVTSITDADGRAKTFTWNASNQLTTITDQVSARSLTLGYTANLVTSIETSPVTQGGTTAPLRWNFVYSGSDLAKSCEPRNNNVTTGYCTTYTTTDGVITQITDPNGHADQVISYAGGKVAWQENGAGDRVTYTYNGLQTQATDELNHTSTYTFDDRYRLVTETNPRNGTTTHEYNASGFRWKTTDSNNLITTRTFDAKGNITSETNGNNETTWYSYDGYNNRLTVRDGRSASATDNTYVVTTAWTGATRRRQSETTPATTQQPTGTVHTWGYTDGTEAAIGGGLMPAGLLETDTDPNANVSSYRYDAKGNLRERTDALGLLTTFTFDELGRVLTETTFPTGYAGGLTTSYAYDALGNVVQIDGPLVTNTITTTTRRQRNVNVFDPAGNPTSTVISDIGGAVVPDVARTTTRTFDNADRPLTITDPEGGITTNAYDAGGNLVQVTDARNVVHQFGFDATNLQTSELVIAAVTDPGAPTPRNVTVFTKEYDTAGRLTSSTDALGRTTQYGYDNANRQTTTTLLNFDNRNSTTRNVVLEQIVFDAAGNPTSKTSGGGLRTETFVYDQAGRLTTSTLDPSGLNRVTAFVYDANGNVFTRTITAGGRTEQNRFTYNPANQPLTQTTENGTVDLVTSYSYDNRGLQASSVDPRGNLAGATAANFRTDITYDELGRQTRVQSPPVSVTTVNAAAGTATTTANVRPDVVFGYNTYGDQTHKRDERSNVTVQAFDRLGRVVTITHPTYTPSGGSAIVPTEQMVYDPNGNLTSKTDRRGETTTFVFDGLNRPVRQTDPQVGANPAGISETVYDDTGNIVAGIDQRGARTEYTYDDLNRVRTQVDVVRNATPTPFRYTTTMDYDDLGNVTYQQTPTGDVSTAVFNTASEMTSSTDPGPFTTTYTRDLVGRITVQTDPLNRRTETDYDLAGRATTIANYDSVGALITTRTSTYDAVGNQTAFVSPRGNGAGATPADFTTTVTYDALSRPVTVVEPTTATTTITTSYGYDAAGNVTRLTDGRNNQTLYDYQPWNLQATVIEPSTTAHAALAQRTWTTSFDGGGLAVKLVEPGPVTVTRTFDDLGRLTNETGVGTAGASATRTYGYDAAGLMTTVNAPGGNITFTYDDRGLVTGTDGPATAFDSSFTYDPSGRMLSRTDGSGTSNFTWNSRNLLATATSPLLAVTATHSYDSAGQRVGTAYTGGGTRTYTYDGLGRITNDTLRNTTNTVTAAFDLGYDLDSNITRRTITLPGNSQQGVHTYGYDNVGRITSWTKPGAAAASYVWDAAGNLTTNAGVAQTFDQRNRILTSGTTTWTWTPRGTMATQKIGTAAATNLTFDGLNRATASSGQAFTYDGLNRVATNGATAFSYAGAELDPTKVGTTLIAHGPSGEPLSAKIGTAAGTLLGVDPHNDITHRFAGAGTVSATRLYEPFGKPTITSGTMVTIGFQGDYTNTATGDVWMGARWYKPGAGAFTARDTVFGKLDTPISLNRYTYAWGDPLGMWDPDGHCAADNGSNRSKCVQHRKGVPRNSGGPGSLAAGHPQGPAVTRDWVIGDGPIYERRISTNYFDTALSKGDRIIASQMATQWYYHCQGDWNRCMDIAADVDMDQLSPEGVGLLMALDQLRLEVMVGKLRFEDHELFDDPDMKKLVSDVSVEDALLGKLPDVAMGGQGSPAGPSCGTPCISFVPPDVWDGPYDRGSAKRLLLESTPKPKIPGRIDAHHVVGQNVGNVTKFGLQAIHDKSNLVWIGQTEHGKITTWQNGQTLYPGLSNNDYLSTLDWSDQLVVGQWLMSQDSPVGRAP